MRSIRCRLAVVFLVAATGLSTKVHAQGPNNPVDPSIVTKLTGSWTTELRSPLTITAIDASSGSISGQYRSPSGAPGSGFPLIGWVNTKASDPEHPNNVVVISFSVRWGT